MIYAAMDDRWSHTLMKKNTLIRCCISCILKSNRPSPPDLAVFTGYRFRQPNTFTETL